MRIYVKLNKKITNCNNNFLLIEVTNNCEIKKININYEKSKTLYTNYTGSKI